MNHKEVRKESVADCSDLKWFLTSTLATLSLKLLLYFLRVTIEDHNGILLLV